MAKKPETVFRGRVVKDLRALKGIAIFSIQQRTINGDPDLLLCINSLFVALELKDDDGEVSPLQEKRLEDVGKAKGLALVARPSNWKKIYKILVDISLQNIEEDNILDAH